MIPPAVVFATVLRMSMNVRTTENSKLVISEQKYFPVLFFVSGVCGGRGGRKPSQFSFRAKTCVKMRKTVVFEAENHLEETPVGTRGDPRGPVGTRAL